MGTRPARLSCVPAGSGLERLTEIQGRVSEASAAGRRRSCGFRNHQHSDRLAGREGKALQTEVALCADCRISPVRLHAISIEDLPGGCVTECFTECFRSIFTSFSFEEILIQFL